MHFFTPEHLIIRVAALIESSFIINFDNKMPVFQLQIMSDLQLETPAARPTYEEFDIQPECQCLALLGDIGNVSDSRLFDFFERQLRRFETVMFLLGNHEPYGTSFSKAVEAVRDFEEKAKQRQYNPDDSARGKFIFLNRTRYDLSESLTVLGCTLFSSIIPEQHSTATQFVSDFCQIEDWAVDRHNSAHQRDLKWLNSEVFACAQQEPKRTIVVLTHYSPTVLAQASDLRHVRDDTQIRSAFTTDLSSQVCWTSQAVKLWAFGHTHFNCDLQDPQTKKRIVTNQKGYRKAESLDFSWSKVVEVNVDLRLRQEDLEGFSSSGENKSKVKRSRCVVS